MKITIDPGSGPVEIAGEGRDGVSEVVINGKRSTQVLQYLRGAYAKPVNRGNLHHTISFSVSREHSSNAAALKYNLLHTASMPEAGLVKFQLTDDALVEKRYLKDAQLLVTSAKVLGVRSIINYQIQGGKILPEEEL